MSKLDDTARELGFKIKKGPTKFAGYVLIDNADEESYPLGDDFSASLADVESYLESYADDIAAGRVKPSDDDDAEPEVETFVSKVKPLSPAKLHSSLRNHEAADQIKEAIRERPPHQTKQQVHDREALDYLLWVVNDPRASGAFYKQSKALQEAHWKKLRLALEADEKAKAAKLPKSTITIQDLDREERARQTRKFHKINEKFRTNLDSIRDPMTEDDRDFALDLFRNPEKDRADLLRSIERENAAFLSPEAGPDYAAPTPSTGFARVSIGRRR
jgi:hypothetical protein